MGQWVVGAQATSAVNHARGIPWNDSIITAFLGLLVVQVPPTTATMGQWVVGAQATSAVNHARGIP